MGKLRPQWLGPFKIIEVRHDNAFALDLPPAMRINKVVSVRYLKPYVGSATADTSPPAVQSEIVNVSNFRISPDADGYFRAEFEVQTEPPDTLFDTWFSVKQCVDSGAFELLADYLASLGLSLDKPGNNYLGRLVDDWEFSAGTFRGIVSSFDSADSRTQYEVFYADGDSRWISRAHLVKILVKTAGPRQKRARFMAPMLSPRLAPVRALVLFSGTDSVGRFMRKHLPEGSQVINMDSDPAAPNAMHINIFDWDFRQFAPGFFDILWMSPPCTEYSVAKTIGRRNLAAADALVQRALEIKDFLAPRFWVLENPLGLLRDRVFMKPLSQFRQTTSYCLFGDPFRKNTDLWMSNPLMPPLEPCSSSRPCVMIRYLRQHLWSASLAPARGVRGAGTRDILHKIPERLLETVFRPFFMGSTPVPLDTIDEDVETSQGRGGAV